MEAYQNTNNLSYEVDSNYNTPSEIQTTAENIDAEESNLETEQTHKSVIGIPGEETRYPLSYETAEAPVENMQLEAGIEKYALDNIVHEQLATTEQADENINEQIEETLNTGDAAQVEQPGELKGSVEPDEQNECAENEQQEQKPENDAEQMEQPEEKEEPAEPEKPKEPKIDPIQCRICNTKENLTNIFDVRGELTIAQYIMNLCHGLRISERDSLPHLICSSCSETVSIAYSFKIKCESADKDFRSKLKRSQNKRRAATDYVLLDASKHLPPSSSDDEPLVQDDDEFKVSETDEPESGSDEDFQPKKKKVSKKKAPKKQKPTSKPKKEVKKKKKEVAKSKKARRSSPPRKDPITKNVVYIEAVVSSSDDEVLSKRRRTQRGSVSVEARKAVVSTPKLNARPLQGSGRNTKITLQATPKKGSSTRLSHTQQPRKKEHQGQELTGRDLFRSCAPVTTTHWSDSFSD